MWDDIIGVEVEVCTKAAKEHMYYIVLDRMAETRLQLVGVGNKVWFWRPLAALCLFTTGSLHAAVK